MWISRLIQVNELGAAMLSEDSRIDDGSLGDLVCRYRYEGLGRLIRKETPLTSP